MAKDIWKQFNVSLPRMAREYAEALLQKPGMPVADLPGLAFTKYDEATGETQQIIRNNILYAARGLLIDAGYSAETVGKAGAA